MEGLGIGGLEPSRCLNIKGFLVQDLVDAEEFMQTVSMHIVKLEVLAKSEAK